MKGFQALRWQAYRLSERKLCKYGKDIFCFEPPVRVVIRIELILCKWVNDIKQKFIKHTMVLQKMWLYM